MTLTSHEEVRLANEEFYRAFEALDLERMRTVWLPSARVQCTHPGWRRLAGQAAVMESWEGIFENTMEILFDLSAVEISVSGDVAWVVCTENIATSTLDGRSESRVEATNVFERHDGRWRMVNHHGSPVVRRAVDPDLH
jgi:uncharacterized protein (TIGR02246 family)